MIYHEIVSYINISSEMGSKVYIHINTIICIDVYIKLFVIFTIRLYPLLDYRVFRHEYKYMYMHKQISSTHTHRPYRIYTIYTIHMWL